VVENRKRRNEVTKRSARNAENVIFDTVVVAVLLVWLIIVVYPLYYVIIASISNPVDIISGNIKLMPRNITFQAYERIMHEKSLFVGYRNTLTYTIVGTTISVLLTVMLAYPLSRPRLAGRKIILSLVMFTMIFNGGMIPTFLLVKQLRLLDSIWAVILPAVVSTWNMLIMRTFFATTIPSSLLEAAEIDGCSHIRTLCQIVLPLSKAIIAVMVLFYAVAQWNSYFDAMIYLSTPAKFPLQLILRDILLMQQNASLMESASEGALDQMLLFEGIKYAMIFIASAPLLIVYPFLQKYFVKGVMIGAIKG
jgi:putative aldouronate transport system permease protein